MDTTSSRPQAAAFRDVDVYHALDEPAVSGGAGRGSEEPLAPALQALGHITTATGRLGRPWEALDAIVRAATVWVPGCESACLVVTVAGGGPQVTAATDPLSDEVADVLARTSRTPWSDPTRGLHLVRVDDLRAEGERWPTFSTRMAPSAVRSLVAVRLPLSRPRPDEPVSTGALVLLSRRPGAFDEGAEQIARLFATYALLAVSAALQVDQARAGLSSRDTIGMAKGMLMARHGLDSQGAFQALARASRDQRVPLREVAVRLVDGVLRLEPDGATAPA